MCPVFIFHSTSDSNFDRHRTFLPTRQLSHVFCQICHLTQDLSSSPQSFFEFFRLYRTEPKFVISAQFHRTPIQNTFPYVVTHFFCRSAKLLTAVTSFSTHHFGYILTSDSMTLKINTCDILSW